MVNKVNLSVEDLELAVMDFLSTRHNQHVSNAELNIQSCPVPKGGFEFVVDPI